MIDINSDAASNTPANVRTETSGNTTAAAINQSSAVYRSSNTSTCDVTTARPTSSVSATLTTDTAMDMIDTNSDTASKTPADVTTETSVNDTAAAINQTSAVYRSSNTSTCDVTTARPTSSVSATLTTDTAMGTPANVTTEMSGNNTAAVINNASAIYSSASTSTCDDTTAGPISTTANTLAVKSTVKLNTYTASNTPAVIPPAETSLSATGPVNNKTSAVVSTNITTKRDDEKAEPTSKAGATLATDTAMGTATDTKIDTASNTPAVVEPPTETREIITAAVNHKPSAVFSTVSSTVSDGTTDRSISITGTTLANDTTTSASATDAYTDTASITPAVIIRAEASINGTATLNNTLPVIFASESTVIETAANTNNQVANFNAASATSKRDTTAAPVSALYNTPALDTAAAVTAANTSSPDTTALSTKPSAFSSSVKTTFERCTHEYTAVGTAATTVIQSSDTISAAADVTGKTFPTSTPISSIKNAAAGEAHLLSDFDKRLAFIQVTKIDFATAREHFERYMSDLEEWTFFDYRGTTAEEVAIEESNLRFYATIAARCHRVGIFVWPTNYYCGTDRWCCTKIERDSIARYAKTTLQQLKVLDEVLDCVESQTGLALVELSQRKAEAAAMAKSGGLAERKRKRDDHELSVMAARMIAVNNAKVDRRN
jgi:hypothetical protein